MRILRPTALDKIKRRLFLFSMIASGANMRSECFRKCNRHSHIKATMLNCDIYRFEFYRQLLELMKQNWSSFIIIVALENLWRASIRFSSIRSSKNLVLTTTCLEKCLKFEHVSDSHQKEIAQWRPKLFNHIKNTCDTRFYRQVMHLFQYIGHDCEEQVATYFSVFKCGSSSRDILKLSYRYCSLFLSKQK